MCARQRHTWHVMLLSCVQGMLFPLHKNSRLVCTIPAHTAGAFLQASGAGVAKARAAVVRQLSSRMPSDVHIHIHVSSELRKGFCRQLATLHHGAGFAVASLQEHSEQSGQVRSAQPEGEKQLRAKIRGHLMREARCYCHCDSKAAPRARHSAADHRVGSCRHGHKRLSKTSLSRLEPFLKSEPELPCPTGTKNPANKYDARGWAHPLAS